jgi:hypothetical protein
MMGEGLAPTDNAVIGGDFYKRQIFPKSTFNEKTIDGGNFHSQASPFLLSQLYTASALSANHG